MSVQENNPTSRRAPHLARYSRRDDTAKRARKNTVQPGPPAFPRQTALDRFQNSERERESERSTMEWERDLIRRERRRDTLLHVAVTLLAVLLLTLLATAL